MSDQTWGAHLNDQVMPWLWSSEERSSHINILELRRPISIASMVHRLFTANDNPADHFGRLHSTLCVSDECSVRLSRPSTPQAMEWMLKPEAFQWVCQRWWMPNIDLFTAKFNWQLLVYISPVPDPQTLNVDTFTINCIHFQCSSQECYNSFNSSTAASRWPNHLLFPDILGLADPNQWAVEDATGHC